MTATAQIARELAPDEMLDAGPPLVEHEDFTFLMTNIYPKHTGLPMVVWVGPGSGVRHDVRVKVCMVAGAVIRPDELATVAVRPEPRLLHGSLSARDFALVSRWITLNEDAILRFWNEEFDGFDFVRALRKLEP